MIWEDSSVVTLVFGVFLIIDSCVVVSVVVVLSSSSAAAKSSVSCVTMATKEITLVVLRTEIKILQYNVSA